MLPFVGLFRHKTAATGGVFVDIGSFLFSQVRLFAALRPATLAYVEALEPKFLSPPHGRAGVGYRTHVLTVDALGADEFRLMLRIKRNRIVFM